ncbi:MAG: hypothetical protein HKP51_08670 [Sulfitobacter sp.]|nr:hypothetical protein [Sulfitobacter sp.]
MTPIDEERIMRLHAVCRTIQSTVGDIKQVVRAAQVRHKTANRKPATAASEDAICHENGQGMDTVRALVDACSAERDQLT